MLWTNAVDGRRDRRPPVSPARKASPLLLLDIWIGLVSSLFTTQMASVVSCAARVPSASIT
jgi:hypothetical protein